MLEVLFVDDEPQALEALRDALHRHRHDWNMHFVTDGEAALRHLATRPVDVVVSDFELRGINGYVLLTKVSRHLSEATRIILSGTPSARHSPITKIAHAVLTKPCDIAALERAITSAHQPD